LNLKKDSFSSLIHHHKLATYIDQFFQHFQDIFDSTQMMKENDVYFCHQYSQFSRRMEQIVPLPGRIDEKDIKATFKDGLLSIRIPKRSLSQTRKSFIEIE
jgi:hypothetical protein